MKLIVTLALAALGVTALPAPASAGKVYVVNCTDRKFRAKTYDRNDSAREVAHSTKHVPKRGRERLKCDTKRCKLQVQPTGGKVRKVRLWRKVKGDVRISGGNNPMNWKLEKGKKTCDD